MIRRQVRRRRAWRVAAIVGVPLAVWLAGVAISLGVTTGTQLAQPATELQNEFSALLGQAAHITTTALRQTPDRAAALARSSAWRDRLEGVGVVGPTGRYADWVGFAPQPTTAPGVDDETFWNVLSQGQRTRLIVNSAVRGDGTYSLGSFLLDSSLGDLAAVDLFRNTALVSIRFAGDDIPPISATGVWVPLLAPDGSTVGQAWLEATPPGKTARRIRGTAAAAAVVLFAVLLTMLVDLATLCHRPLGWLATVAGLAGVRWLLLVVQAPDHLLPRSLSSPGIYGTATGFGLLSSPADLLLTALMLLGVSYATRKRCRQQTAVAAAVGTAALTVGSLAFVSGSLARQATVARQLFERADQPLSQLVLLLSLMLTLVAAAESMAVLVTLALRLDRARLGYWPSRVMVGAVMLPLAALSVTRFQQVSDSLAHERVSSEFAPQVLEQASLRRLALRSSVIGSAERKETAQALRTFTESAGDNVDYTAYGLWVDSELFHIGYQSSLDVYDNAGHPVSHFGFDLPPLRETIPLATETEEDYPAAPGRFERLLHVEAPVVYEGERIGTVVGHVLDEASNLPFLPSSLPYLLALGPGVRPQQAPDYVLYDTNGAVLVSTLPRPPPLDLDAWLPGSGDEFVRIDTRDKRFDGLVLRGDDRIHLLLVRVRPLLDRLAVLAKLFLLGIAALAALALIRALRYRRNIGFLLRGIRESFYRRLVTTLLLASLPPLIGLAVFLAGYFEGRSAGQLDDAAAGLIGVVQRVIRDYAAVERDAPTPTFNDEVMYWLRDVVEQEIHLYQGDLLLATSKRELFDSGLLPLRLPGEAFRSVVQQANPYLVLVHRLGATTMPVAYARIDSSDHGSELVVAVPLILQQKETRRDAERVEEMLILTTVLLAVMVVVAASLMARTVARPVRQLVDAAGRIAAGDYSARLIPQTHDEMAELVRKFNTMAQALAEQRSDLERRRDYIETLLSNATTGVVSTDAKGRLVTFNPAAARLLDGRLGEEHVGADLDEVLAAYGNLAPLRQAVASRAARDEEPVEVDLRREGDVWRLRMVRVALPDPEGGPAGHLILLDDVTDLMRSNQLAAWAEMARAIAHEIKNPLTPIQLATEHLERLLADRNITPSPTIDACIETVKKQVIALREIASEFSAYAKLPAMVPRSIDPVEFVREVVSPYRLAPPDGIAVEERYEDAPPVMADGRVLARGVVNLVENALQAMADDGGTLRVGVEPADDGRQVLILVEDTGPGLDPDARARLFEPYFSTKSSGTGLGLAIVRRAVEEHGGRIEVESEPGAGASFRIHLPAAPPRA